MLNTNLRSIATRLPMPNDAWATDNQEYDLPVYEGRGVMVTGKKRRNRILEFFVSGPSGRTFTFRGNVPAFAHGNCLYVILTWGDGALRFYLEGKLWQTAAM